MSRQGDNQEDGFTEGKLIQAVKSQIESENSPAARVMFSKLTLVGYEHDEALGVVACMLTHEIDTMLAADRASDSAGYEYAPCALPTLPDDE